MPNYTFAFKPNKHDKWNIRANLTKSVLQALSTLKRIFWLAFKVLRLASGSTEKKNRNRDWAIIQKII